jgi:hypothetical protein
MFIEKDDCVKYSTPDGVAHSRGSDIFYKHANPPGLTINLSLQTREIIKTSIWPIPTHKFTFR